MWSYVWFTVCLIISAVFVTFVILTQKEHQQVEKTLKTAPQIIRALQTTPRVEEMQKLVGVIVEPREHENLSLVIKNFQKVLPNTDIFVFHGTENAYMLEGLDVHKVNLGVANLAMHEYNYLFTRPEFWERLPSEYALVFQTDSVLFSKSQVKLEDYFQYDYVGAPWKSLSQYYWRNAFMFRGLNRHAWAGNGGLSLRKCSKMVQVTRQVPFLSVPYAPEDVYFSYAMDKVGAKVPTREEAARLFFEEIYGSELPLGAHKFVPKKFLEKIEADELQILENY